LSDGIKAIIVSDKAIHKLKSLISRVWSSPGVRPALMAFLGVRIALLLFAPVARGLLPAAILPHPILRPYLGVEPVTNPWLEPWQRWDTLHFQAIAERGYGAYDTSLYTPFLFPLLMRLTAGIAGGNTLISGLILSNLSYLIALYYLFRLTAMETDQSVARRCVFYLSIFPMSFFFLAAYSESLFLLTAVASLYHARQKQWLAAGAWGFLAPITRLQGALLPLVLGFEIWRTKKSGHFPAPKAWGGLTLSALGVLAFPLYVRVALGRSVQDILHALSERFHGHFVFPGLAILSSLKHILAGKALPSDWFDLGFTLLFIVLTIQVVRKLPAVFGLYSVATLILVLMKVAETQPLLSAPRYTLGIFPAFIVLAQAGKNSWVNRLIVYLSLLGLMYFSGQFFIWGWVA
jgi:hypothetical protein